MNNNNNIVATQLRFNDQHLAFVESLISVADQYVCYAWNLYARGNGLGERPPRLPLDVQAELIGGVIANADAHHNNNGYFNLSPIQRIHQERLNLLEAGTPEHTYVGSYRVDAESNTLAEDWAFNAAYYWGSRQPEFFQHLEAAGEYTPRQNWSRGRGACGQYARQWLNPAEVFNDEAYIEGIIAELCQPPDPYIGFGFNQHFLFRFSLTNDDGDDVNESDDDDDDMNNINLANNAAPIS